MSREVIMLIVIAVLFVALVALIIIKHFVNKKIKQNKAKHAEENLDEFKGVRYTDEQNTLTENGDVNISFNAHDIVLKQNVTYTVGKKNKVMPGKYIVLSSNETQDKFNLRIGTYVREYKHNQEIILADGETICAVSGNVILR